jgi:hypothetical protein
LNNLGKIMDDTKINSTTLKDVLQKSATDPFLKMGPPAPMAGWIYRDFPLMPQAVWFELLDLLGDGNVKVVAAQSGQLPPAPMCRAQIWISPEAQARWDAYVQS